MVKEIDNKKNERKGKDNSNHIFTEKITMRKCEKRSIHPILPEDFVEAPCMMLGEKKVVVESIGFNYQHDLTTTIISLNN